LRKHINKFFPSSSLSGVSSLVLFPLFATGVVDTGGNLPLVSLTPVANFPRVTTAILVKIFLPVSLTVGANLPLAWLIPVVHLVLRISI
jgi:hypothetical protein